MSGWPHRRHLVEQLLDELPAEWNDKALPLNYRLHLALLRADNATHGSRDPASPLRRLRTSALSSHDFAPLSTLSSTGSFTRVELVKPAASLAASPENTSATILVMKTVDKRWAFRMRAHQHVRHELAVLRLSSTAATAGRIPSLIASFLSPTSFHLVLSHSPGGDLWSIFERHNEAVQVGQEKGLPEDWVRCWAAELVEVVAWLHAEGWAHRDIKPQNLLLDGSGHLQLTDFGSSAPITPGTTSIPRRYCRVLLGTPDYISPEVLKHAERVYQEEDTDGEEDNSGTFIAAAKAKPETRQDERAYGAEVDWWGCGVVFYELLFGCTPFFAEEISETYDRIVNWKDHLRFPPNSLVSEAARATISALLVEAEARPLAAQIKSLPWFTAVEWDHLRSVKPAYIPGPAALPSPSASASFARTRSFGAAQSFDFTSFFSSPGLSILRPSPRATNAAQTDEIEYWTANEWGGLTTLPSSNAFEPLASTSKMAAPTIVCAAATSSDVLGLPHSRPSPQGAFSTPARPYGRLGQLALRPESATRQSQSRLRRVVSGMDAWREMQEHAWTVGRSAAKRATMRPTTEPMGGRSSLNAMPTSAPAAGPRPAANALQENASTSDPAGRQIDQLQGRHRAVLEQLDRIDDKYRQLFELCSIERHGPDPPDPTLLLKRRE